MVFAAGRGTRLKPFTDKHPKCLAEAAGRTLLEHCLRNLKQYGVDSVVVNVHHFADQVEAYLYDNNNFGLDLSLSYEEQLLETGGGLLKARQHFENEVAFIAINSDVYTDLDLWTLVQTHEENDAIATLAVAKRKTSRYLHFDNRMELSGWENQQADKMIRWDDGDFQQFAFQGIQVLSPAIFEYMEGRQDRFSTIPVYLDAARAGEAIRGFRMDDAYWIDIGEAEKLERLRQHLNQD